MLLRYPPTASSGPHGIDQSLDRSGLGCSELVGRRRALEWGKHFSTLGGSGESSLGHPALWICGGLHVP